jgi:hypothetical protein
MQIKNWIENGKGNQRKSRKTPKFNKRKKKQLKMMIQKLKGNSTMGSPFCSLV